MLRERDVLRKYLPTENRSVKPEPISRNGKPQQTNNATQKMIVEKLSQHFNNAHGSTPYELKVTNSAPSKPFNLYDGWVRYPEADEPELWPPVQEDGLPPFARPELVGFLTPAGTPVTMTVARAIEEGLINHSNGTVANWHEHSQTILEAYLSAR